MDAFERIVVLDLAEKFLARVSVGSLVVYEVLDISKLVLSLLFDPLADLGQRFVSMEVFCLSALDFCFILLPYRCVVE